MTAICVLVSHNHNMAISEGLAVGILLIELQAKNSEDIL